MSEHEHWYRDEITRLKDQIERLEKTLDKVASQLEAKDKLVIEFAREWRKATKP